MDKAALSQQPYLTFFSDDTADYDVIVDQSSSAPNLKEATWGALQPMLPLVAERMGPEEMALVLEYSPMPESFLEKLKAIQEQKAQQGPPPDPEMLKVEAMQKAKMAELQMKQQEAQMDMQLEQQKVAAQIQLERQKAEAQIQLEREKAAAQLMIERERAENTMTMQREKMGFDQSLSVAEMERSGAAEKEKDDTEESQLASAIQQMAQSVADMAKTTSQGFASLGSELKVAQSVASLGKDIKDAMTKPKTIVRGPDGRAIGVE